MKKIKKWKSKHIPNVYRGSFTIEISILLPFLLFLITSILYLLFFLYDESCAEQIAYLAALRGSKQMGSVDEKKEIVESYCQDMQEELQWGIKSKDTKVDCTNSKVRVELKGQVVTPFGSNFFHNSWSYQIGAETKKIDSVQLIRNYRKLTNIVEEE